MARSAIVYVDGFNFYHGAVRRDPDLKWLNFEALAASLIRGHKVLQVNYYTAVVKDRPDDPSQSQRQDDYLRALRAQPRTKVILGQFQKKKVFVTASPGWPVELEDGTARTLKGGQQVRGKAWEEKGSDVNLGTDLSWDACSQQMQVALVLSNPMTSTFNVRSRVRWRPASKSSWSTPTSGRTNARPSWGVALAN